MQKVTLRPDLPPVAVRPTRKNPDIKVVIGNDNGKLTPREIIYPDYYSAEQITSGVNNYLRKNENCSVCQKYAAERKKMVLVGGGLAAVAIGIVVFVILKQRRKKK